MDKWDYFLRDNSTMKLGTRFDYKRHILFTHIEKVKVKDGCTRYHIAIRDKEADSLKVSFNLLT